MLKQLFAVLIVLTLSGCGITYKPTVPLEYNGETAIIMDTYNRTGSGSAHFFILTELNSNPTIHSLTRSFGVSQGQGNNLTLLGIDRPVPAQPLKLKIRATSFYVMPIAAWTNKDSDYQVVGEIAFTPKGNQTYLVTGNINDKTSEVWIEDMYGNAVSDKFIANNETGQITTIKLADQQQKPLVESLTREQYFANLKDGESVEFVVRKLGEPDSIEAKESGFFSSKPDYIIYAYKDLGKVYFSEHKEKPQYILKTTK